MIWRQVGRPWLHWSARSVRSMSRSSAFISSIVSARLARTAPWQAIVESSSSRARSSDAARAELRQLGEHRARQLDDVAAGERGRQRAQRERAGGERREVEAERAQRLGVRLGGRDLGGVAAKVARDQQRLLRRRRAVEARLQPLVDDALVRRVHVDDDEARARSRPG